jgi:hypothetical protein
MYLRTEFTPSWLESMERVLIAINTSYHRRLYHDTLLHIMQQMDLYKKLMGC